MQDALKTVYCPFTYIILFTCLWLIQYSRAILTLFAMLTFFCSSHCSAAAYLLCAVLGTGLVYVFLSIYHEQPTCQGKMLSRFSQVYSFLFKLLSFSSCYMHTGFFDRKMDFTFWYGMFYFLQLACFLMSFPSFTITSG